MKVALRFLQVISCIVLALAGLLAIVGVATGETGILVVCIVLGLLCLFLFLMTTKVLKAPKLPKSIRVMYYEGELPGFGVNQPCQIFVEDSRVRIFRISPEVTVKLDIDKIQGIDLYFKEEDYMLKYHGNATSTSKTKGISKSYFTINYAKDGNVILFSFWCTAMEISAIRKLSDIVVKGQAPIEISI